MWKSPLPCWTGTSGRCSVNSFLSVVVPCNSAHPGLLRPTVIVTDIPEPALWPWYIKLPWSPKHTQSAIKGICPVVAWTLALLHLDFWPKALPAETCYLIFYILISDLEYTWCVVVCYFINDFPHCQTCFRRHLIPFWTSLDTTYIPNISF